MTMIENKSQNKEQILELFPLGRKSVELSFTGERISSDGGLLLLREVDKQIGLIEDISSCIYDNRDSRYIDHTIQEMVTQRVFQIAAGYEDSNDCNDLRSDMILKTCAGRLPQTGNDLASQSTMSRLENMVGNKDLYNIGELFIDQFIKSYSSAPKIIILDCDDTDTITYGQQELALYNNYYNDSCYMPLHIYEGLSGKLVTTILKPGRRNKQSSVASLLKRLVIRLRAQWPKTRIVVRGDSHFTSRDFMDWCNQQRKLDFITGLTGNAKLHELAKTTIKSAKREFNQYGKPVKRYHSFTYKAGSWSTPQKVVVKVEVTSMGTNIRYIVTSMHEFKAKGLYEKGYCARGAMELRIKEHKLYLKSDRASCKSFKANQFRLFLHSMAYVLLHTMQKELFKGTELVNASFKTIQNKIIKTAAWVREMKTKIKIEFPKFCPTKDLQTKSFEILSLLKT
ncbi:MAG TPA: IS1380 family transposase [Bacilli bacterium]|nr:IS1380 family transposase [Bacilli bacterium]